MSSLDSDDDDDSQLQSSEDLDSDAEMPYETAPRKRRPSWEPESKNDVERLPIKLADGRIQKTGKKSMPAPDAEESEDDSEEEKVDTEQLERHGRQRVEDVATGARFGRPAVVDVIANKSRKARIQGAKDQIASICQEIVSEPENSASFIVFAYFLDTNTISCLAWTIATSTYIFSTGNIDTGSPRSRRKRSHHP